MVISILDRVANQNGCCVRPSVALNLSVSGGNQGCRAGPDQPYHRNYLEKNPHLNRKSAFFLSNVQENNPPQIV